MLGIKEVFESTLGQSGGNQEPQLFIYTVMTSKQRQVIKDIIVWYAKFGDDEVLSWYTPKCGDFNECVVISFGGDRMFESMLRAGYSTSMALAVKNLTTQRAAKFLETIEKNLGLTY